MIWKPYNLINCFLIFHNKVASMKVIQKADAVSHIKIVLGLLWSATSAQSINKLSLQSSIGKLALNLKIYVIILMRSYIINTHGILCKPSFLVFDCAHRRSLAFSQFRQDHE
jgi:hypothetical protein